MTLNTVKIVNAENGEEIIRNMTLEEIKQDEIDTTARIAYISKLKEKEIQRQTILNRLGLTEEEAQLIIGGSN
jgi:hypothetical protein